MSCPPNIIANAQQRCFFAPYKSLSPNYLDVTLPPYALCAGQRWKRLVGHSAFRRALSLSSSSKRSP